MKSKKNNNPGPECGLSFEQAMTRLEQIVGEMEASDLALEEVLAKYEEGTRLVRFCSVKLEEAEKKIELLTKKGGEIELQPFAPPTEEPGTPGAASDEGRLF